jgi:hypothetical protein
MKRFIYQQHHLDFISSCLNDEPVMGYAEAAKAFTAAFGVPKTAAAIHSLVNRGTLSASPMAWRSTLLTPEQHEYLAAGYKVWPRNELAIHMNERFGLSLGVKQLVAYAKNHGISSGRSGQFKKGEKPHNAGTKGLMKPNSGSFKPGNRPHTWRPIGSERITDEGYRQRKVTDTGYPPADWEEVHRLVWQEHHGPIPAGHVVTFIDGDRLNCTIGNLELVSRADHAARSKLGYCAMPAELKPAMANVVSLSRAIRKRKQDVMKRRSA